MKVGFKIITTCALAASIMFSNFGINKVYATGEIKSSVFNSNKVIMDDKELSLGEQQMVSIVKDGEYDASNYMPIRGVFEALGYTVDWDGQRQAVILNSPQGEPKITSASTAKPNATVGIKSSAYNSNRVILDGKELDLGGQPMIWIVKTDEENASNYMPVRGVLQAMGYHVEWNGPKQSVIVSVPKDGETNQPIPTPTPTPVPTLDTDEKTINDGLSNLSNPTPSPTRIPPIDPELILQHIAGLIELTEEQKLIADVNGNGIIDPNDATLILRYMQGLGELPTLTPTPTPPPDIPRIPPIDPELISQHIAGLIELSEEQKLIADVNGNGIIDPNDATLILRYMKGLGELPVR